MYIKNDGRTSDINSIRFTKIYKYLSLVIFVFAFQSCASFREGLYLKLVDRNTGDFFLEYENNVKLYLEEVINFHEGFTIKAYTRNIFSFQKKKTKLLVHSFYVITDHNGEYHTISFYGSEMNFYSRGVWVMNSDSDSSAYSDFIDGKSDWDVAEIEKPNGIDTGKTVRNIITMMDNNIQYYYLNHLKNKLGMHNCNTALDETLTER